MALPKYRKLRYIPGSFSLVLLPIAFYCFTRYQANHGLLGAIPLYFFDSAFFEKLPLPKRNFTDIVFTGKPEEDNVKLQFAQIRIREILVSGDTVSGLHFLFTRNSNYENLIHTLDKLRIENAKYYLPDDNHIWFYHMPPEKRYAESIKPIMCGFIPLELQVSWWSKTWVQIGHIWKSAWELMVIYILFAVGVLRFSLKSHIVRKS